MKRPSWRHKDREAAAAAALAPAGSEGIPVDASELSELSHVFAPPTWLWDIGKSAWLLVGVALCVVGLIALAAITSVIVEPVLIGLLLATVSTPIVSWLERKGVPRVGGAFIVLLGLLVLGVLILLMVLGGIVSQGSEIKSSASAAVDTVQSWLGHAGSNDATSSSASESVSEGTSTTISTFVHGFASAIQGVTALIFFVVFSVFSVLFMLKDGPSFRRFVEGHMGVPPTVAQVITGHVIRSLRRYFGGVTIVAAFNAVVVGVGALILDVPLAGTIAVVTFVTAYVPFIGAFVSGAFAVILALGSEGTQTAVIMLVVVLLANGLLQNVVQPIAFGATLRMNPLLVLVATIGFGAIFGMLGLVLGAPLTSAVMHISSDLGRARASAATDAKTEGEARLPPDSARPLP